MTTTHTKESLAALLNGIEYPGRASVEVNAAAKAAGLVIVFGESDDLMEFEGAIRDEADVYNGGTILIDAKGPLPEWDQVSDDEATAADYVTRKPRAREITANWRKDGYAWSYDTTIPHATFDVMEMGEPYCKGIVFDLADLGPPRAE